MIYFRFEKNHSNMHGTQKPGEAWNRETVKGPKFKKRTLERKSPGFSWRFIFYFPSGKWWNLDVFSKRSARANHAAQP